MKIKAIYEDSATGKKTPILVLSAFNNGNVLCMNEKGELIYNYACEIKITDERYLSCLKK